MVENYFLFLALYHSRQMYGLLLQSTVDVSFKGLETEWEIYLFVDMRMMKLPPTESTNNKNYHT